MQSVKKVGIEMCDNVVKEKNENEIGRARNHLIRREYTLNEQIR